MKIIKYKLLLSAVPFPIEWAVLASSLKAAIKKAKSEIKYHFNLNTSKLIEYEILKEEQI